MSQLPSVKTITAHVHQGTEVVYFFRGSDFKETDIAKLHVLLKAKGFQAHITGKGDEWAVFTQPADTVVNSRRPAYNLLAEILQPKVPHTAFGYASADDQGKLTVAIHLLGTCTPKLQAELGRKMQALKEVATVGVGTSPHFKIWPEVPTSKQWDRGRGRDKAYFISLLTELQHNLNEIGIATAIKF